MLSFLIKNINAFRKKKKKKKRINYTRQKR